MKKNFFFGLGAAAAALIAIGIIHQVATASSSPKGTYKVLCGYDSVKDQTGGEDDLNEQLTKLGPVVSVSTPATDGEDDDRSVCVTVQTQ